MRARLVAALVVAGALATPAAAQAPAVAVQVLGQPDITVDEVAHWARIASITSQGTTDPGTPSKAPATEAECVDRAEAAGRTATTATADCARDWQVFRQQVLQFLVSGRWLAGEAARAGIVVTDAQVRAQFARTKAESFPEPGAFDRFLAGSGMTLDDLLYRVRLDAISNRLRAHATAGVKRPTLAEAVAYYRRHRARYAQPERRDLLVVVTRGRAAVLRARAALLAGRSWAAVARRYSVDRASARRGGRLPGFVPAEQSPVLGRAVAAAPVGALRGPVLVAGHRWLFRVMRVHPAAPPRLARALPSVRQLLASIAEQRALEAFIRGYRARWRARTTCAPGYVTSDCANGPAPPGR